MLIPKPIAKNEPDPTTACRVLLPHPLPGSRRLLRGPAPAVQRTAARIQAARHFASALHVQVRLLYVVHPHLSLSTTHSPPNSVPAILADGHRDIDVATADPRRLGDWKDGGRACCSTCASARGRGEMGMAVPVGDRRACLCTGHRGSRYLSLQGVLRAVLSNYYYYYYYSMLFHVSRRRSP